MNNLIYHNYILHSCKYSKKTLFNLKIIDNSRGSISLNEDFNTLCWVERNRLCRCKSMIYILWVFQKTRFYTSKLSGFLVAGIIIVFTYFAETSTNEYRDKGTYTKSSLLCKQCTIKNLSFILIFSILLLQSFDLGLLIMVCYPLSNFLSEQLNGAY